MNLFRSRAHHLIDCLSDEDLSSLWNFLETFYLDAYMLRAIQNAKQTLQPGDALTHAEALELLSIIQPSLRYL
jgi:hypothetical protein